jgi:hypothetical protein
MDRFPLENLGHNLPASSLVAASQAAVGFGAGLLVSRCLSREVRDKLAFGLLIAGAAALAPVIAGVTARIINRPDSSRRVRKRLETIRTGAGLESADSEMF